LFFQAVLPYNLILGKTLEIDGIKKLIQDILFLLFFCAMTIFSPSGISTILMVNYTIFKTGLVVAKKPL